MLKKSGEIEKLQKREAAQQEEVTRSSEHDTK
jgi:hypothetical protein